MKQKSKKIYTDNPALSFITHSDSKRTVSDDVPVDVEEALRESVEEIRSKRINLVIQPSLYRAIKELAYQQRISANEACIRAITEYIENALDPD